MNRTILKFTVVFLLCAVAAGCKSSQAAEPIKPAEDPIAVKTAVIKAEPMPQSFPLTGTIVANQQADAAANLGGRVTRTFVERGDMVKKGDLLIQLDVLSGQLSEAEAEANLATAEVQRRTAEVQCKRNQELLDKGVISRDEWERTDSQCKTTVSSASAAAARAGMAKKNIRDTSVRAPFSGLVGDRYVSVGEYVQPGSKVATIVQTAPLRVQLSVPEDKISAVAPKGEVHFRVSAYPDTPFTGIITYIAPSVRATTRDLVFEAVVDNADGKLRPGMFVTANLALPDETLPVVPKKSIKLQGAAHRMMMVVDGHIEERVVQLGPERGDLVAILDGVKPGERYVTELSEKIKDGIKVR